MNTTVSCTLSCDDAERAERLEQAAMSWFRYTENRFSRFRSASELVHLNDRAGGECLVSSAMLEVLQLAEAYRKQTEGAFNPFILDALERCGYDRSFETLAASHAGSAAVLPLVEQPGPASHRSHSPSGPAIRINSFMQSASIPAGASIDLGGIVKSWAVKRLSAWLRRKYGVARGLLNAGGDLAVWGGGPGIPGAMRAMGGGEVSGHLTAADSELAAADESAAAAGDSAYAGNADTASPLWRIGIEHPWTEGGAVGLLLLGEGASATSSTLGRRWEHAGETMHHLIDPATMRPAASDIVQCTTSGGDPVACEIWAKTLCILGSEAGIGLLARAKPPIEALLFSRSRDALYYGNPASLGTKWIDVPATRIIPAFD